MGLSPLPPFWEVVLRITFASFCGAALSVWAPPRVLPQFLTMITCLIALCFSVAFPTFAFGVAGGGPAILIDIVFGLVASSMLLAAFTVSNGLSVAVFGIWSLWLSSFQFGPDRSSTILVAEFGMTIAALEAITYRDWVQNGFSFTVDVPPAEGDGFFDVLKGALSALCASLGKEESCWEEALPGTNVTSTFEVTIENGDFAGQTAYITPNAVDSSLDIVIPGGLWVVAGLWKWKGLANPLAGMRNFALAWTWGMLCVFAGILVPPIRTGRRAFSRGLIPAAIKDVRAYVQGCVVKDAAAADDAKHDEEMGSASSTEEAEGLEGKNVAMMSEEERNTRGRLVRYCNQFAGGNMAAATAYEPRLFRAPFECSWIKLKELMRSIHFLIIPALVAKKVQDSAKSQGREDAFLRYLIQADNILDKCASALAKDEDCADELDSLKLEGEVYDFFERKINNVLKGTAEWLKAMHHPSSPPPCTKEGFKNTKGTYLLWFISPIRLIKGLINGALLPFRRRLWHLHSFLWGLKWAIGSTALYCMSVFWEAYVDYGIDTSVPGGAAGLFNGWNILAYGFTWTPTVEGTVKKGLQRCTGSAAGGFAAWLGIIVCSWSYDDNAEINPYGLVAWITACSFLNAIISRDKGAGAQSGMSQEYGYNGVYFGLTLGICALEVYAGNGTKGDIVVNRVVTTLTGVAMAMVMALLPPYNFGNDPGLAGDLIKEEKAAVAKGLRLLIGDEKDKASELKTLQEDFHERAAASHKNAVARLNDATQLSFLPLFNVDPKLGPLLDELVVTASMVYSWLDLVNHLASRETFAASFASDAVRQDVESIIKQLDSLGEDENWEGHLNNIKDNLMDCAASSAADESTASVSKSKQDTKALQHHVVLFDIFLNLALCRLKSHAAAMSEIETNAVYNLVRKLGLHPEE